MLHYVCRLMARLDLPQMSAFTPLLGPKLTSSGRINQADCPDVARQSHEADTTGLFARRLDLFQPSAALDFVSANDGDRTAMG